MSHMSATSFEKKNDDRSWGTTTSFLNPHQYFNIENAKYLKFFSKNFQNFMSSFH